MVKIRRVLISVFDKTGIEGLAKTLSSLGCEIISTGGTKRVLEEAGIKVRDISSVTGNPEAFDGRMKTISFEIESALLFDREKDADEALKLGIQPIDMVVCNLYPFEKVKREGASLDVLIENIDIGGPTMIRAAAKNYKYVAVVTDSHDYDAIIRSLNENNGALDETTRFNLMRKAFNHTADYDAMIADTMNSQGGEISHRLAFDNGITLRYGENSHQQAVFLRSRESGKSLYDMEQLHGKELSYNNIVDIYGAIEAVKDLKRSGCAIIKHTNPCGLCEGADQNRVFELAWAGDPVSSFGSVIAFNRTLEKDTAEFLQLDNEDKMKRKFIEVTIAPDYAPDALEYLMKNKNLRVIKFDPSELRQNSEMKFLFNSLLYQTVDDSLINELEIVTETSAEFPADLVEFGVIAMRQLKSNAIAIARKTAEGYLQLLGMGCGQPNRVNSTELALKRARENLKNEYQGAEEGFDNFVKESLGEAILFSDAFFPFPDNIEMAAAFGIRKAVQPGGSIRDKSVIRTCNSLGIAMAFTGIRHFKH